MKLDISQMRYLTSEDFKVLNAVELGSKDHNLVPTSVITKLTRANPGAVNKSISTLAKHKLISRVRNAKYDGYKLTYNGHDYLALKSMLNKDSLVYLGTTVGVGKESDIYSTRDKKKMEKILKVHRLGRTSFKSVKTNRDYLKKNVGGSWMYLSRIAANKEYQFLSTLYDSGFNVPKPYDYSRHCILMQWIQGYPMTKLYTFKNYKKLYSDLMKFIVKLANYGLIHCDFNEFNIMIRDDDVIESQEYETDFVILDFPQSISIDHPDAEEYFRRDVECVKLFFKRRFKYEPKKDSSMLDTDGYGDGYKYVAPNFYRDVKRIGDIDVLLQASGYKRKNGTSSLDRDFESAMGSMRRRIVEEVDVNNGADYSDDGDDGDDGDYSDHYDSDYDSEDVDDSDYGNEEEENEDGEENEKIIEALRDGVERLKVDKLGNYILE